MSIDTELAWAAGFFEGEGCVSSAVTRGKLRIRAAVTQNGDSAPRILTRFVDAVHRGKVLGPYDYSGRNGLGTKPRYVVQFQNPQDVDFVLRSLHPYLSDASPKWLKYLELLDRAQQQEGGERTL